MCFEARQPATGENAIGSPLFLLIFGGSAPRGAAVWHNSLAHAFGWGGPATVSGSNPPSLVKRATGAGGTCMCVCGESGRKETIQFRKELFSRELRARFAQGKLTYINASA